MFGYGEIVVFMLLSMATPVDVEPLPPDQVVAGLDANCEVLAFGDMREGVEGINAFFEQLSRQSWIIGNEEAVEGLAEVHAGLAEMQTGAQEAMGLNPLTDIHTVSLCGRLGAGTTPEFVLIARGDFPSSVVESLGPFFDYEPLTLSNGASVWGTRDGAVLVGLISPAPGLLVMGTDNFLVERGATPLVSDFSGADPSSLVAQLAALAPRAPRMFLGFQPSEQLKTLVASEDMPVSVEELFLGLSHFVWASNAEMSYFDVAATNDDAFRDYQLILGGLQHALQASPHVVRAYTAIALGALSPDDPEIDDFLRLAARHRDEVMDFLSWTGLVEDVSVEMTTAPAERRLTLTASGSGNLLVAGIAGAVFYLAAGSGEEAVAPTEYQFEEESIEGAYGQPGGAMVAPPSAAPAPEPAPAEAAPDETDPGFVPAPGGF